MPSSTSAATGSPIVDALVSTVPSVADAASTPRLTTSTAVLAAPTSGAVGSAPPAAVADTTSIVNSDRAALRRSVLRACMMWPLEKTSTA